MFQIRMIDGPTKETLRMLKRHILPSAQEELTKESYDCIALVQCWIPSLYYFADVAKKASAVDVCEISGNCPQHVSTLGIFGAVSSVKSAVAAIELHQSGK